MKRDNLPDHKSVTTQSSFNYENERIDLACAFRWTVRMGMHEAIANHFSLAVNEEGSRFLLNPKQHFSRIKASDILLLDTNSPPDLKHPDAPDLTAWGLHSSIHRHCPHARCVMHVHPIYSTVLCSLADSNLPPIDQNTTLFYKRYVIDDGYVGLAFEKEGERCASLLSDPKIKIMIMGNHGLLVIGSNVAELLTASTILNERQKPISKHSGQVSRYVFLNEIAEKTAQELEKFPDSSQIYFAELKAILDEEEPSYRL